MIDIRLQSEYIFSVLGLQITNTFFTSVLVTVILAIFGLVFYLNRDKKDSLIINGMRILIFEWLKLTDTVTQDRKLSKKILPLIATFFIFIVFANLIELIPGFLGSLFINTKEGQISILRSPSSDLTTTVALAVFSVLSTQAISLKTLGVKDYIKRFINFANPIKFILGFFELLSETIKIISFSFRLFGNIFAGEVLLIVMAFLIPYFIPLPFMILEVFVGVLQAFIFAMLTLTFIKTSIVQETT